MQRFEEIQPNPGAMIASLRAIGYDLSMAIADLIDNSIYAGAKNIWIKYHWDGPDSWIYILDDGHGMAEDGLRDAMRLGSQSPLETRDPKDLGRFGLGLKTASFSQCKALTVCTKKYNSDNAVRSWDLDHVEMIKRWELSMFAPSSTEDIIKELNNMSQGTMVIWQKLDRIVETESKDDIEGMNDFYKNFLFVIKYLEMVFHRYLKAPYGLNIRVGESDLKPWDPFLTGNTFTQQLAIEKIQNGKVSITPYVLPHVTNRTDIESRDGAGPKGWNAQQGFYLYRNKRMIVSGGYLNLNIVPEEHYKLTRIMVDIDNTMDHEWEVDVKKATAYPPDRLKPSLEKIAKATRKVAVEIYRARTARIRSSGKKNYNDVWKRIPSNDKVVYKINKGNEVIDAIIKEIATSPSWINKLFHVIETTVPHQLIIIDSNETEDCHVDLSPEINKPSDELIELCIEFYKRHRNDGRSHEVSKELVLSLEPFNKHPAYIAALESL